MNAADEYAATSVFSIGRANWLWLAGCGLLAAVLVRLRHMGDPVAGAIGPALATTGVAFLFAIIAAYVVWQLRRRRPNAGRTAFALTGLLTVLLMQLLPFVGLGDRSEKVFGALLPVMRDFTADLTAAVGDATSETLPATLARLDRRFDSIDAALRDDAFIVAMRGLLKEKAHSDLAFGADANAFAQADIANLPDIGHDGRLDELRGICQAHIAAIDAYSRQTDAFVLKLRDIVDGSGFSVNAKQQFLGRFEDGQRTLKPHLDRINDADREHTRALLAMLAHLTDTKGRWAIDTDGAIAFSDDAEGEGYDRLADEIRKTSDALNEATEAFNVARSRRPSVPVKPSPLAG